VVFLAVRNFATLLGVTADSPLRWGVPITYVVVALAGVIWGAVLRYSRPDVYATIGLGARSVTASTLSAEAGR
jgi:hypothetical protein